MYGASLRGVQVAAPIIYRGTFGTGMFQCLYQPGAAHWAMLPSTLEWHVAAVLLGAAGALFRPSGWLLGAVMLALSLLVAAPCVAALRYNQRGLSPRLCPASHCRPLLRPAARSILDAVPHAAFVAARHAPGTAVSSWPS